MSKTLKTTIGAARVLLMAGLVGVSAFATTAPSMAQAFGLQFGSGFTNDGDERDGFLLGPELAMCLTDAQIRHAIADRGYTQIYLNIPDRKHVQVKATMDGIIYLIDFNYCTNKIEGRNALRAAR
ncbi:hypothetical protein [Devosia sp.]|uniref:hypothetical protein n=1 Tax=Devosia sp. TaxID=1871048 RepID=UPI0032649306